MPGAVEGLGHAIVQHLQRVSDSAPDDLPAARLAAVAAAGLGDELGLGPFVGPVLSDAKPRLLLRFHQGAVRRWSEEDVVLKVYGDGPRGEGPLQSRWAERGVRTVPVLHGCWGPCSWILMPALALQGLQPTGVAEWLTATDALAGQARLMHEPAPDLLPVLRPLGSVMSPRLSGAVASLRRAGHQPPAGWEGRAADAYVSSGSPLHGDLALSNVGLDPAGRLVVYDASALLGPSAFDAARWAARAASAAVSPDTVLARWAQHEPLPETDVVDRLLEAECLLEAGSRCAVAERLRASPPHVDGLLETARRLAG